MRLSLGFGLVGVVLSMAIAMPVASGGLSPAAAQSAGPQKSGKSARKAPSKKSAGQTQAKGADTDRLLDSAAKSLADGNAGAAMTTLDGILAGGGLASNHMARALYLRGVAHRRQGRPAQAIADLNSAIWLKGGLNEADRNAALAARSDVSREVGIADPAGTEGAVRTESAARPERSADAPRVARVEPAPAPSAPAPAASWGIFSAPSPAPSADVSEGGFPRAASTTPAPRTAAPSRRTLPQDVSEGGFPRATASPPPPPQQAVKRDATVKGPTGSTSSWDSGTKVATKDGWVSPEGRQGAREAAPAPSSPSGSGLGDFFSGLFTGNASSPTPAAKPSASADWSASTRGPSAAKGPAPATQPKGGNVVTSSVPAATAKGRFRLQIAAVRSRTEAESVAARVKKDHGRVIGAHRLEVDQTVYGNMGTFYRVQLGPFAAADEPKALCDRLRPSGYDCLVLTQ